MPIHICTESPCPVEEKEYAAKLANGFTPTYTEEVPMTPKSPQEIIEESADVCMAVLQGFVLGRYGDSIKDKELEDEFRLELRQAMKDLLDHAIERMPRKVTKKYGRKDAPHLTAMDVAHSYKNNAIDDCIAVLKELRETL